MMMTSLTQGIVESFLLRTAFSIQDVESIKGSSQSLITHLHSCSSSLIFCKVKALSSSTEQAELLNASWIAILSFIEHIDPSLVVNFKLNSSDQLTSRFKILWQTQAVYNNEPNIRVFLNPFYEKHLWYIQCSREEQFRLRVSQFDYFRCDVTDFVA